MIREAILVAHGSPADPVPQEAVLQALAVRVAMWLPGWKLRGVTLAMPGALEAAVAAMGAPLIYPFFMAEGWFTRVNLPRRLAGVGAQGLRQVAPFGVDPGLAELMEGAVRAAVGGREKAGVLIAAHGSKVSKSSSASTYEMVAKLEGRGLGPVWAGFVEEAPYLTDVAREVEAGICLPFFAQRAGHVVVDLPQAMISSGFKGELLPPIGEDIGVARLIAAALERAQS